MSNSLTIKTLYILNRSDTGNFDRLSAEIAPEVERNHAMLWLKASRWPRNIEELRAPFEDGSWHTGCIDALCRFLRVGAEERAQYFGE